MRPSLVPTLAAMLFGSSAVGYAVQTPPLDTKWTYTVGTNPWPEYPRPLLQRPQWQTLNGIWKWRTAGPGEGSIPPVNESLTQDVLIPSCLESGISGVQQLNVTYAWFTRELTVPEDWSSYGSYGGRRILLNFEAVDYEATVFINGHRAGDTHTGGYSHFNFDVTELVQPTGTNQIHVFVFDPTDLEGYNIPLGKQTREPSHIFYRSCTGLWQTVWIESVPASYISGLDISAGMDGQVTMNVSSSSPSDSVTVSVTSDKGDVVASYEANSNTQFTFTVDTNQLELWSPNSPTLYNITVVLGDDAIESYTGFRTISSGKVNGITRPLLNGEFVFQFGTLDQGFWPDGIYTPPNYEAMVSDLQTLKDLGANMLRKHIKVENALFYQACDQIGLMLFQDMPSMNSDTAKYPPTAEQQAEFEQQFKTLINQHKSYPSIITWIVYNEGWGQLGGQINQGYHPEFELTAMAKSLDPTRLVDSTTGWYDHGAGDFSDNHHYASPQCGTPFYSTPSSPWDSNRIAIQGEFGGIGLNVSAENLWNVQAQIDLINETYELNADFESYNYRAHFILSELREQVERYACSGAIWTQTTDVEGEVNGLLTYDRRITRPDVAQWKVDIQALYDAAAARGGAGYGGQKMLQSV